MQREEHTPPWGHLLPKVMKTQTPWMCLPPSSFSGVIDRWPDNRVSTSRISRCFKFIKLGFYFLDWGFVYSVRHRHNVEKDNQKLRLQRIVLESMSTKVYVPLLVNGLLCLYLGLFKEVNWIHTHRYILHNTHMHTHKHSCTYLYLSLVTNYPKLSDLKKHYS